MEYGDNFRNPSYVYAPSLPPSSATYDGIPVSGYGPTSNATLVSGERIGTSGGMSVYTNAVVRLSTWIPPVPGYPAKDEQIIIQGKSGWDAGAYTVDNVELGGIFEFQLEHGMAVMAGLATLGMPYAYSTPKHAWLVSEDGVYVVENGLTVFFLAPELYSLADVSGWTFRITRLGGKIRYSYGVSPESQSVVFETHDYLGQLYGIGMPYSVDDHIDGLKIYGGSNQIDAAVFSVSAKMTEVGVHYSDMTVTMPSVHLKMHSSLVALLNASMPPFLARMAGNIDGTNTLSGRLKASLPCITMKAVSEPYFFRNNIYCNAYGMDTLMRGAQYITGDISANAYGIKSISSELHFGKMKVTLPVVTVLASDYLRDFNFDIVELGCASFLDTPFFLISCENIELTETAVIAIYIDLITAERIGINDSASIGSVIEILSREGINVSDSMSSLSRQESLQYAVNLSTGAASSYSGFNFKGFTRVGDVSYAWDDAGIYRIGSNTDNGKAISAMVDFGISDFGIANRKVIPTAWLGLRTDGQVYLRVNSDGDNGDSVIYKAIESKDTFKSAFGRGLAGRQWSIALEIKDSSFASLDSIELEISTSQRRSGNR